MADATSDNTSGSAIEAEDAQAEQLLGDALEGEAEDGDSSEGTEGEAEADQLGDAGKRALESMKGKWRDEKKRRQDLEQQLAEAQRSTEDSDGAPDVEAIRAEAERAASSKANQRIVRAEIKSAAAGKFADPADALTFLDLDQFEVDENGELDSDEVTDALDTLLKNKPYLSAATAKRFQGSGDGGARNGSAPKQITTRAELAKLSADEQMQAYHDGRLRTLLNSNP